MKKERFTRSSCKSGNEPLSQEKRKFELDVSYLKNSGYKWIYIKDLSCRHCFLHLQ